MKKKVAVLDHTIELPGVTVRVIDVFFLLVMLGLGISMRARLFDIESGDFHYFLADWMKECHRAGGFGYLGIEPGISDESTINYGCMYQYVIVLLHYFRNVASDMHLLKMVSVIFDIICAVTIMRISYLVTDGSIQKAILSFGIVMFLPTVMLNSAAWAQCDSIYTAFALLCVLHCLKGNNMRVFIYLALSYSFKQQAIFLIPFVIILWLKGKIKARYVMVCPVVLFLTMVPALLAGRHFKELVGIYVKQVTTYTQLTMNYPSIYAVIVSDLREDYRKAIIASGTFATVAVLGALAYYIRNKSFDVSREYIITLLIFSVEVSLFTLPVMHERYGYLPEIAAVSYGVTRYKRMAVCMGLQFVSLITYSRFLFGSDVKQLWPLSIMMFFIILWVGYDLYKQMEKPEVSRA